MPPLHEPGRVIDMRAPVRRTEAVSGLINAETGSSGSRTIGWPAWDDPHMLGPTRTTPAQAGADTWIEASLAGSTTM